MAILFLDGFDHYNSIAEKWTYHSSYNPSFVAGRFSGQAFSPGNEYGETRKTLNDTGTYYTTLVAGCAFYAGSASLLTGHTPIGFMRDGQQQFSVKWTSNNHFGVYRQTTLVAEETTVRAGSMWYYVELKVTFATGATGSYELRVNGVSVLSAGSVQTAVTNANANQLWMENAYSGTSYRDDLYALDTSGGAPGNDFLGDIRVETLYPNANGTTSQLVGSDADSTDNYLLVDETDSDEDTTYVESSTVGNKDTYNYGALTTTAGTVYAAQINCRARKTDAGTRSIATIARHSGTEVDSADRVLGSNYAYVPHDVRETKPGGGAWSVSDINGAEFGVKVTA